MPAGVVGKVGANEAVGKSQLLVHRHARHLHNHPPVVPAMDWGRWEGEGVNMDSKSVVMAP